MDQQNQMHVDNEQVENGAFGRKFAGHAVLWAVLYAISANIGALIPETAEGLQVLLRAAVMLPVMAALRLTGKNTQADGFIRFFCQLMFGVMLGVMLFMIVMAILLR